MAAGSKTPKGHFAAKGLACACMIAFVTGCAPEAPNQTSAESADPSNASTAADTSSTLDPDSQTTDQMWSEDVTDAQLTVFCIDGRAYVLDDQNNTVSVPANELRDGGFYQMTADVTYLNGGVAGYVNYPEIHEVTAITEISPLDLELPSIADKTYDLVLIGDYAEGDLLLNTYAHRAVWRDGEWVWRYDEQVDLGDGRKALVRKGVSKDDVRSGADAGTLSSADYFVLPAE